MALGNTLEALLGAVLLKRVVGFRPSLDRLRDVLGLVVLAAGLSTLVSATIGVTSGWLGGSMPAATYGDAWHTWWLGDALGDLVMAPFLFVWSRRGRASLPRHWIAEGISQPPGAPGIPIRGSRHAATQPAAGYPNGRTDQRTEPSRQHN